MWSHISGKRDRWWISETNVTGGVISFPLLTSAAGWKLSATPYLNVNTFSDAVWENKDGRVQAWIDPDWRLQTINLRSNAGVNSGWRLIGPK